MASKFAPAIMPTNDGDYIYKLFNELINARSTIDADCRNNLAAIYGKQWTTWDNTFRQWVNNLSGVSKDRVYLALNKLRSIMSARNSFIVGDEPSIYVEPDAPETIDRQRAKIAQRVARAYWEEHKMHGKFLDTMEWVKSCAMAFGQVYYDPGIGRVVGKGSREQYLYEGKVKYRTRSLLETVWDPIARDWDEIRYVICSSIMPIEEIEARGWEINWDEVTKEAGKIGATSTYEMYLQLHSPDLASTISAVKDQKGRLRNILVLEYWEAPTAQYRNGRYLVVVGKTVVKNTPLEIGVIPIVPFYDMKKAGVIMAQTPVTNMRAHQEHINRLVSNLVERAQMPDIISFSATSGLPKTVRQFAGRPLVIGQHNAFSQGNPVQYVQGGQIRQDFIMLFRLFEEEMEKDAGVSSLALASPKREMSGRFGYIVTEANRALLQDISYRYKTSVQSVMRLILGYIQKFYTEDRTANYISEYDRREIIRYKGSDIGKNFSVRIELGKNYMQNPVIIAQNALQMTQNPIIAQKIVENPVALKHWMSAVNPDANEWFVAEQDVGVAEDENFEISKGGVPQVEPHHDNKIHMQEHKRMLDSDVIRTWHPIAVEYLKFHYRQHDINETAKMRKKMWEMQQMNPQMGQQMGQQKMVGSPGIASAQTPEAQIDQTVEALTQARFPGAEAIPGKGGG